MIKIFLKPDREKSVLRQHPWIFSGAVARLEGQPGLGETVEVYSSRGKLLGHGAYSPESQIRVRLWTWGEDPTRIDADFLRSRLQTALERRRRFGLPERAQRLVHAESDGLPGLVVDRYADSLVVQFLSAGPEFWRETLVALLLELTGAERIFERSDADVRALEGLPERVGLLAGPPLVGPLVIEEHGLRFQVDLQAGHKTGFYLDQRDNRACLRRLAQDRRVLDCFSYSGGFALNALAGGARQVTAVDSSAAALELAAANLALNGLPAERVEWLAEDVFQYLRKLRDMGRSFDLIVLDPPKFAPTASQAQKAARGYKDINLLALKLLAPGGTLMTFSCSGGIDAGLFQKIVAGAALDAGLPAQIAGYLHPGADHPVALHFPEGAYLKGLLVTVG